MRSRFMIVDDNEDNLTLMSQMLGRRGFDVVVASSGREALDLFAVGRFSAVLMDIEMPEMDGIECTRQIRQREPDSDRVPIIAVTAHALKEYRDRALAAGMDDFLTKPIGSRLLLNTIASWIFELPTVLVVDDFADSRLLTDRTLRSSRAYRVITADNGHQAIAQATTARPSAILLDVEMPEMKGWEVAAKLAENEATWAIPIIFVTGHDEEELRERWHDESAVVVHDQAGQAQGAPRNAREGLRPSVDVPRRRAHSHWRTRGRRRSRTTADLCGEPALGGEGAHRARQTKRPGGLEADRPQTSRDRPPLTESRS